MSIEKKVSAMGGQAVIEGVMMRSNDYYTIAVRNEKGKIVSKTEKIKKKPGLHRTPFIRGAVNLVDMMVIGIQSLTWSASQVSDDSDEKLSKSQLTIALISALGFAILFFVGLPYLLSILTGVKEESSPILFNLIDGIIKIAIFLIYLYLISLMKDVRRVFEYHGAEHKTVYCYEAEKNLTVKNVKKYSTKHPRCGTSFLFIVLLISIFVFALIPSLVQLIYPLFSLLAFPLRKIILFALRILFIPIIASISYELLKLSGKYQKNMFVRIISYPGILLQYITTKEPDDKQIEVAIAALKLVLSKDKL